jgi:UDP-perosamine 4-acetyltransferase
MRDEMRKEYIMLGNGGHSDVCRDVAQKMGYAEAGFVLQNKWDGNGSSSKNNFLGTDQWLFEKAADKPLLINGIGGAVGSKVRENIFSQYSSLGFKFLTLIHPSAQIVDNVLLGEGVQVMAGVIIQPNCQIKTNSIINTRTSIDHDCIVEEDVHIAPGAILCGNVIVKKRAFIGAASCIVPSLIIGVGAIIGAGTTVLDNVPAGRTFTGR